MITNAKHGPAGALGALGDSTRRAIFERLGEQPSAVVDLAADLPVSRPAVSQHLKVLKEAGLVRDVQVGTRHVYSLDPAGIEGLRDYLDRFWTTALATFKARLERPADERAAEVLPDEALRNEHRPPEHRHQEESP